MSITFGAVGDIISVCLLVKDLVEALDKTRGSKAEYQSAIRELWILDRALLEIDLLTRTHGNGATPELRSLCETANQAATRCKGLVAAFLDRVRKYKSTFGECQKPNVLKDLAMKVRWRSGESRALEEFRAEIMGTSSSLQMLLATANVTLLEVSSKDMRGRLDAAKRTTDSISSVQIAKFNDILNRIEEANRGIDESNSILGRVAEALRMDWLRQLGTDLKALIHRAIALNVATYHAVLSIQKILPSRLERGLIEEPFILEDPIGRIAPVHLQFVTSWDAFNAVLETRFRSLQGHEKIKRKKYVLQDRASKREIEQSRPWQRAFLPGQRVEMSFVFQDDEPSRAQSRSVICPGCRTPSSGRTDADVHCDNCLMWFRRIMVVEDIEPPPQEFLPKPWKKKPEFGKPDLAVHLSGPLIPGRKRTATNDIEGEEDVRSFKRVRLLSTKKRVKQRRFGTITDARAYSSFSNAPSNRGTPSAAYLREERPAWITSERNKNVQIKRPDSIFYQLPPLPAEFTKTRAPRSDFASMRKPGLCTENLTSETTGMKELASCTEDMIFHRVASDHAKGPAIIYRLPPLPMDFRATKEHRSSAKHATFHRVASEEAHHEGPIKNMELFISCAYDEISKDDLSTHRASIDISIEKRWRDLVAARWWIHNQDLCYTLEYEMRALLNASLLGIPLATCCCTESSGSPVCTVCQQPWNEISPLNASNNLLHEILTWISVAAVNAQCRPKVEAIISRDRLRNGLMMLLFGTKYTLTSKASTARELPKEHASDSTVVTHEGADGAVSIPQCPLRFGLPCAIALIKTKYVCESCRDSLVDVCMVHLE